jgi:hypothetical protein
MSTENLASTGVKARIAQLVASLYSASTIASLLQQWQSNLAM